MKTYVEHMNAISSDGFYIGLLGYRMFAEKLPPVFTSESFLNYCLDKQPAFENKACLGYIIRNIPIKQNQIN